MLRRTCLPPKTALAAEKIRSGGTCLKKKSNMNYVSIESAERQLLFTEAENMIRNLSRQQRGLVNSNAGVILIYPYDKRKPLRSLDMFLNKWNP